MEFSLPQQDPNKKYQDLENVQLVLKGQYEYLYQKKTYSEEIFNVYKNNKDSSVIFDSELLTRLDSGEFLKVSIFYQVNKNWIPIQVDIKKQVGRQISDEKYRMDLKKNILNYQFISGENVEEVKIQVPPKFQISTYNTVTSFLFIASKKYDSTGKNYHNLLITSNLLSYSGPPQMNYIVLDRVSTTPQQIRINEKVLKAIAYRVHGQEGYEKKNEDPIRVYISRHFSIPYLVEGLNGIKVQIKFLTEVEASNLADFL